MPELNHVTCEACRRAYLECTPAGETAQERIALAALAGEHLIKRGLWRREDDGRTFIELEVAPGANLSCEVFREDAIAAALRAASPAKELADRMMAEDADVTAVEIWGGPTPVLLRRYKRHALSTPADEEGKG